MYTVIFDFQYVEVTDGVIDADDVVDYLQSRFQ